MHHLHAHPHKEAPQTTGNTIHKARLYNSLLGWLLRRSENTILDLGGVKPGHVVLDVGCGPGSLTIAAKKRAGLSGKVYGVDASPQMIEEAHRQAHRARVEVNFELGLAESLPFESDKFDVVLSRLAFHHFTGDLKNRAVAEIYRVLKPGGCCLVVDFDPDTIPGPGFLKKWLTGKHRMMSIVVEEYVPLLEESGLREIECGPTGHRALSFVRGFK